MPDTSTVHIEGLDRVVRKLRSLEDLSAYKTALYAAAEHVLEKIADYPPLSEANRPNARGRWYERGYGPRWASGGRKTSEMLGRKWTTQERNAGMTQVVGNNVSYGPFVQDRDRQAAFHKRRGWKTIQTVAEEESRTVVEMVAKEVDKKLSR